MSWSSKNSWDFPFNQGEGHGGFIMEVKGDFDCNKEEQMKAVSWSGVNVSLSFYSPSHIHKLPINSFV
jgi:hypothetical protein